jgi:hypothetical protein
MQRGKKIIGNVHTKFNRDPVETKRREIKIKKKTPPIIGRSLQTEADHEFSPILGLTSYCSGSVLAGRRTVELGKYICWGIEL